MDAALVLAVPVGLVAIALYTMLMTVLAACGHLAQKFIDDGKINSLWIPAWLLPLIITFIGYGIPCMLCAYFGSDLVYSLADILNGKILTVVSLIGGMLPAVGIAINLSFIFKDEARIWLLMMSLKLLEDQRIGSLNDEQQSLASSIKENSDRLLNITGELLKLTQVETGKLILSPKITKPIELINYAVSATRVLAERFGCNIEVEYPEKIHKLFVDSEKIAWVITNLLSNAIHYSKENSRIIVGAKEVDQTIQIFVQDFGKGIDPRYHQSIFDRYFRVPGTKVQGSGLGLAISKDFVEAHDGKIWVESEIGKGSKFTIAFPVR